MTWSTLRCRQVSTWPGSGLSGISATTAGTLPFGFLPGRPLGLPPAPASISASITGSASPTAEARRVPPDSVASFIIGPPARWLWLRPTLAVSVTDLKHLFDPCRKCRTRAIRLYRIFVRSNVQAIEQRYYRTVIRITEATMSLMSAAEASPEAADGSGSPMPVPIAAPAPRADRAWRYADELPAAGRGRRYLGVTEPAERALSITEVYYRELQVRRV